MSFPKDSPRIESSGKNVQNLFSLQCHRTISVSLADIFGHFCITANAITQITQTCTHYFPTAWLLILEHLSGINHAERLLHKPPGLKATKRETLSVDRQARERNLTITNSNTSFFNCQNTEIMLHKGFGAVKWGWCNRKMKSIMLNTSPAVCITEDVNLLTLDDKTMNNMMHNRKDTYLTDNWLKFTYSLRFWDSIN